MIAVLQRCSRAAVISDGMETGRIGRGLVLLLGVAKADDEADDEADDVSVCNKMRQWQ